MFALLIASLGLPSTVPYLTLPITMVRFFINNVSKVHHYACFIFNHSKDPCSFLTIPALPLNSPQHAEYLAVAQLLRFQQLNPSSSCITTTYY